MKKFRPFSDFTLESKVLWFFSRGYGNGFFWHDNSFQTPYSVYVEDFFEVRFQLMSDITEWVLYIGWFFGLLKLWLSDVIYYKSQSWFPWELHINRPFENLNRALLLKLTFNNFEHYSKSSKGCTVVNR